MGLLRSAVKMEHNYIGAPSFRTHNPYSFLNCYEDDKYASIYPSVKAIASEFKKIRPYAIDSNGKPKQNVPVINALYHPNQKDSSVAFFEKLAVMNLTHRMTYLLVWRREGSETKPGGQLNANNIAGFTFLENPSISRLDNKTFYNIGAQTFTENEVIAIPGGVDPNSLYTGYAPGEASRRWATLDQYIADYQQGFFENGAVPSGQFIITASSEQDFNDTVDKLQFAHRGADKNNNVTYTPRPTDPVTGKPADSKIEWIPFASTNKEIDFKNIFEQANNRIDSAFGVPASIRGVGENNNYATARLDQQNFIVRAVDPLALAIYTQITHELNRITGGLSVAITYELAIPAVAEEEKVVAETKQVEINMILALIDKGYSLDSAVDALKLSPAYKNLKLGDLDTTNIENDKADVDEGDEVDDSPDPDKIDGVTPLNHGILKNQLSQTDVELFEAQLSQVIKDHMSKQIEKYIDEEVQDAAGDPDDDETEEFTDEMMVVIVAAMSAAGEIQYPEGLAMVADAGYDIGNATSFTLSEAQEKAYKTYLKDVADSYGKDTGKSIRAVLQRGAVEGWDKATLESNLRNIMNTDQWRVTRLATTEINLTQAKGSLHAMEQIEDELEVTLYKIWIHTGSDNPCEFCRSFIDTKVKLKEVFVKKGEVVEGVDGGLFVNDWRTIDAGGLHANCHCLEDYEVE